MKTINLKSLIEIYNINGNINIPPAYMNYIGSREQGFIIKDNELSPLKSLLAYLAETNIGINLEELNSFYIGYEIPQIGKEFDLLRLNKSNILNIEYKREAKDKEKIKKQILRNYYYLKFLGRKIDIFCYIEDENKIYSINEKQELFIVDPKILIDNIKKQCNENFFEGNLNELFEPSNYLISPFRKTTEFIKNEYFLTQEQEEFEQKIINEIKNKQQYIFITGEAGSGKTLLTYHLAKYFIKNKKRVGLIHCGNLNFGHNQLKDKFNWNIEPIKNWKNLFKDNYPDILIIDEIQRINERQFNKIISDFINPHNITLIMSGDQKQTLSVDEGSVINYLSENMKEFKLKSKIRTNKELTNFIKIMLDLGKKQTLTVSNNNIDIVYFNTIEEANEYIAIRKNYSYIYYTPSRYYVNKYADSAHNNPRRIGSAHAVIGQEFENVIVILGEHFYYEGNILTAKNMEGIPYSTPKMFFQQITRAINKLEIVIVNNFEVFNKLIEIFK